MLATARGSAGLLRVEKKETALSDIPQGDGWWIASDGKWYPPHLHPDAAKATPPEDAAPARPGDGGAGAASAPDSAEQPPAEGWWLASDGRYYAPELHPDYVAKAAPSEGLPSWTLTGPATAEIRAAQEPGGWRLTSGAPPADFRSSSPGRPGEPEEFFSSSGGQRGPFRGVRTGQPGQPVIGGPIGADPGAPAAGAPTGRRQPSGPGGSRGRRTPVIVAVAIVIVLAAAGGAAYALHSSKASPPTAAENRAAAERIVLGSHDAPSGWRAMLASALPVKGARSIEGTSAMAGPSCEKDAPAAARRAAATAAVSQSGFSKGSLAKGPILELEDTVGVLASDSAASALVSAERASLDRKALACITSSVRRSLPSTEKASDAVASLTTFSLRPSDASYVALRASLIVTSAGVSEPVFLNVVEAAAGRAVIVVEATGLGGDVSRSLIETETDSLIARARTDAP